MWKSSKYTPTPLLITDIMSRNVISFRCLSQFVFDFNFYHYLFGGAFRGFRITASDFDIQTDGLCIFTGFRGFRGFPFLGEPISQRCLRLAIEIAP